MSLSKSGILHPFLSAMNWSIERFSILYFNFSNIRIKEIICKNNDFHLFNIIFALLIKFSIEIVTLVTYLLGHGEVIPMWAAVLADTGLTVVLVINSFLLLYRKIGSNVVK